MAMRVFGFIVQDGSGPLRLTEVWIHSPGEILKSMTPERASRKPLNREFLETE
jgi:hypothetical protein